MRQPLPRTYIRGVGVEIVRGHPRTHVRGVLWYGGYRIIMTLPMGFDFLR